MNAANSALPMHAPAANDPGLTPDQAAPTGEEDYTQFLQALRKVYRAKRRLS